MCSSTQTHRSKGHRELTHQPGIMKSMEECVVSHTHTPLMSHPVHERSFEVGSGCNERTKALMCGVLQERTGPLSKITAVSQIGTTLISHTHTHTHWSTGHVRFWSLELYLDNKQLVCLWPGGEKQPSGEVSEADVLIFLQVKTYSFQSSFLVRTHSQRNLNTPSRSDAA